MMSVVNKFGKISMVVAVLFASTSWVYAMEDDEELAFALQMSLQTLDDLQKKTISPQSYIQATHGNVYHINEPSNAQKGRPLGAGNNTLSLGDHMQLLERHPERDNTVWTNTHQKIARQFPDNKPVENPQGKTTAQPLVDEKMQAELQAARLKAIEDAEKARNKKAVILIAQPTDASVNGLTSRFGKRGGWKKPNK